MLITKILEIKTTNKNISYYKNIFKNIKSGDIIKISPDQLPENSKTKIKVKCDVCNNEKEIMYMSYLRNIKKYNYYCCSQKCASDKNKMTNLSKYGKTSFTKTPEYVNKTKKTKKERYGDENYVNINKQKETNIKKYGKESFMSTKEFKEKSKKKMKELYNVEYALQSEKIKSKLKNTNNKFYGVDYVLQSTDIKENIRNSKKLKYGDENYNNREKYKESCLNKYGKDNPMKVKEIRQKLYNVMYERYGKCFASQVEEFYNKMLKKGLKIKKYKDSNIYYQGTYELDFLKKYYDKIEIKRGKTIKYKYNNEERIYYPDFYIPELNLIIEIKSLKWYNEHIDKNLSKKEACIEQGYSFMFIIDRDYTIFDKIIKYKLYDNNHCWQYDIKLNTLNEDVKKLDFDYKDMKMSDITFRYVDKSNKYECKKISEFIKKYEWLGKMPNRPTHRFVAEYKGNLVSVLVFSVPNSFSKMLGENTKDIEKLISRGASVSWSPKNIGSSLIMWSIRWMVKNTTFRLFSAYSDEEANEIGTIYQACNFKYVGNKWGSDKLYFDLNNPSKGWFTGRDFRKIRYIKKVCKLLNIDWCDDWSKKYSILWNNIPDKIEEKIKLYIEDQKNKCIIRKPKKKHKYIYILGENKKETKHLNNIFYSLNPKISNLKYPKRI